MIQMKAHGIAESVGNSMINNIQRESLIERKSKLLAEKLGWFQLKIEKCNKRGFPDRMFIKDGNVIFVEFKNERGRLSEEQKRMISSLRDEYKAEVWVISSLEEAYEVFK